MCSPKLCSRKVQREIFVSNIIWIIVIGFVAGIIGRFLSPGPNRPNGFILTTGLGIAGAFVATFIGQTIGWYRLDQGAGLIGATVGALLVLFIWNRLVARRLMSDPGNLPPGPSTPPRRWLQGSSRNALVKSGPTGLQAFRQATDNIRRQTWDWAISSRA
jgi:uncharacterized membrane protein YeaQ/YmgE (transglycosylase-associated protein family)